MLPVKPSIPRNGQGVAAVVLNVATRVQANYSSALASRRQALQVHRHVESRRNHRRQLSQHRVLVNPRSSRRQAPETGVGFGLHAVAGKEPSQTLTQCSISSTGSHIGSPCFSQNVSEAQYPARAAMKEVRHRTWPCERNETTVHVEFHSSRGTRENGSHAKLPTEQIPTFLREGVYRATKA